MAGLNPSGPTEDTLCFHLPLRVGQDVSSAGRVSNGELYRGGKAALGICLLEVQRDFSCGQFL